MVGRSGLVSACCGATLRVQVFLKLRPHTRPVLLKRPWSLRGSRGYAPLVYMGLMAGHAACCAQYTRCCPFGPCTGAVHGAPRPQPLGSGGDATPCEDTRGDHELLFYFLNLPHQVLLSVWVLSAEQGPTVTSVVTGPSSCKGALRQRELCSAFDATAKRLTQCWSTAGSLWLNEGV